MAVVLTPIAQIITLMIFARSEMYLFYGLKIKFHKFYKNNLFVFIVMSFSAVVLGNVVELQLRNHIIKKLSIQNYSSSNGLSIYSTKIMEIIYYN